MVCRWPQPSSCPPTTPSPPSGRGCARLHVGYLVYYRIPWLPSRLSASQVGATSIKCVCAYIECVYRVCVCVCIACVCIVFVCVCVHYTLLVRTSKDLKLKTLWFISSQLPPAASLLLFPPSTSPLPSLPLPLLLPGTCLFPVMPYIAYISPRYSGQRIDVY